MTSDPLRERRTRIRLFPDYADSVIWFFGPVPYERTRLTDDLVAALKAWDTCYYASLDLETRRFTSDQLASSFATEGRRLADLLSAQVGPEFEIEFGTTSGTAMTKSPNPATNPEAEAFFNHLADAELAHLERMRQLGSQSGPVRLVRKTADGSDREVLPSPGQGYWAISAKPPLTDE